MEPDKKNDVPAVNPPLKADHTWFNSVFTQLLAPLVATRYFWLAVEDINPLNFLGKPVPPGEGIAQTWKEPSFKRYLSRNFAALGMGATFLGIVSLYSRNTLHDIKSLYAEAVGYELGKKTEDVTLNDVFVKSRNTAVTVTRDAYTRRTLARFGTASTFFLPWHKLRDFKSTKPKYDANANVGVGAIGIHLYGEGMLREPSFFDIEQKMVSVKIKHNDVNPYIPIQTQDIQSLLTLQRKPLNKRYEAPPVASEAGQADLAVATRIAELMNQTYGNKLDTEKANFTIGKFNFLIGFGLLDEFPNSLAFVELANRSKDMQEVKEVAAAMAKGESAQTAFARYGIDLGTPVIKPAIADTSPDVKFTDHIRPASKTLANSPRSHQEFASQKQEAIQGPL